MSIDASRESYLIAPQRRTLASHVLWRRVLLNKRASRCALAAVGCALSWRSASRPNWSTTGSE
jgi:hypothetical protein